MEQIVTLQNFLNEMISSSLPVSTYVLKLENAMKINGIRAVFGESYPQNVRLLAIGLSGDLPEIEQLDGTKISLELCGGTHVSNTSEIRVITILFRQFMLLVRKGYRRESEELLASPVKWQWRLWLGWKITFISIKTYSSK